MNKNIIIKLVFLLVIKVYCAAEVFIDYDKDIYQGETDTVYLISDTEINNITLTLQRNSKVCGRFRGYRIDKKRYAISDSRNFYAVLLPAASDAYPDNYKIDIRWESNGYSGRRTGPLKILKRDFKYEEIPLNKGLTSLRKDESERRKRETKAIIRLYRKFDIDDQFPSSGFDYPLKDEYYVTSWYGDRRVFLYEDGDSSKSLHNGIDFAAVKGTAVYAAGDGKAVFSGDRLITGNSIIIEHNPGFYSVYYHLDKAEIEQGDFVKKGDKIGEVGSSGISTGNHLHWEVRNQGVAVDPEQFIGNPMIDKERIIMHIKASFSDIDRGR